MVLITGVSSGIGKAAAELFMAKGWQVIGTARKPDESRSSPNMQLKAMEVTEAQSVHDLVNFIQETFGRLDVVVNNAGYGLFGAVETCSEQDIKQQFEVNVFGLITVCQEAIRVMRPRREGVIVNISSIGGRLTLPFYAIYNSTKFAVEGMTEGLDYELEPFGIRVKLVEPGPINTDFYNRSKKVGTHTAFTELYSKVMDKVWAGYGAAGANGAAPEEVAQVIWQAATDGKRKLRYPVGFETRANVWGVKFLPHALIRLAVKRRVGLV